MSRHLAALALALTPLAAPAGQPSLEKLREDLANRYAEPGPHMALARYFHDRGNRLQAFLLLEYARRGLFPRAQFDEAFRRAFLDREPFDNGKEAEARLLRQHARDPKSAAAAVKLADIYISREDWPKAKDYLARAIKLRPEDFASVEALAEVLRREDKPREAIKVIEDHLAAHPNSAEAYRRKIGPLMKKDPGAAGKLLAEALARFPRDGGFFFNRGVLLQDEGKRKEAEEHFVRAAALARDSAHVQGWTGRFFLKVRHDDGRALTYYLNAYFLDPHFYDTEYAERRIGILGEGLARQEYARLIAGGKKPEEVARSGNPLVAGLAVDEMGSKWDPRYAGACAEALGHDDEYVRGKALRALQEHADRSFDQELRALLRGSDLRKKGLAGYLAVKRWGEKGIRELAPWLKGDVQLLRYDAVSALLQYGGAEGRRLVREYRKQERHPWFRRWLAALDREK